MDDMWREKRSLFNSLTTKELTEELQLRTGVKVVYVEAHTTEDITVDGPAIVLINQD